MLLPRTAAIVQGSTDPSSSSISRPSPASPSLVASGVLSDGPQATLIDLQQRSSYGHREGRISTTAVLAGVLGGFGFLIIVGCVFWVVKRRRARRRRELRREARKKRKAEGTSENRNGRRVDGSEVKGVVAHGVAVSQRTPEIPASNEQHAAHPFGGDGKPPAAQSTDSRHPAMRHAPALSPPQAKAMNPPSSPKPESEKSPQMTHQSPRQQDVAQVLVVQTSQQDAGRPETPIPIHPPLQFSASAGRASSPARFGHPKGHIVSGLGDGGTASDTEYFSDASTATRQTLTNTGRGSNSRTTRSPRTQVQQTVLLDHPPAYTPG